MAAIRDAVRRVPWARQPQFPVGIDQSNPIAAGLQATFSPVLGRMVDTYQGGSALSTGDTGAPSIGAAGISRAYSGGTKSTFANSPRYGLASAMTIVIICDVNTLTNFGALISCQNDATTAGWELRLGASGTDSKMNIHRANQSSYNQYSTAANRVVAGSKNNFIAVTYSSSAIDSSPTCYVNGLSFTTTLSNSTGSGGAQTASTGTLDIGARAAGTTQLDGAVLFAALWNRALSADEVESVRRNSSQVYQAPARRIWTATGGVIAPQPTSRLMWVVELMRGVA